MDYTKTELNHCEEEEVGSTISLENECKAEFSEVDQQPSSMANELGLIELLKENKAFELIHGHCQSNLPPHFQIVSILRNGFTTPFSQAKLKAFQIYTESVAKKTGEGGGSKTAAEVARVKYGWCSVDKEELKAILMFGFSNPNGLLHLSPDNAPLQCLIDSSSSCEKDGVRFLLLSRIIMGKSEIVFPRGSSTQAYPSCPEFDSGLDSSTSPKKYIIWSTHMNTHVLPEFVVCIKTPPILKRKNPKSPWIPFPVLIKTISKFVNPSQIRLIQKHYKELQESRISRSELIQRLRSITGDRILIHIIKSFGQKASEGSRPINLQSMHI